MPTILNYTGRRAIDRKQIRIVVRGKSGDLSFDAVFDAKKLGTFPGFAQIWLEAHRGNLWMQWPWGTIEAPTPPTDRKLHEFDVSDGVWFRLKVVQPPGHEHNKLLGEAARIPFILAGDNGQKRHPLLIPVPEELGNLIWKVDFDQEEPLLLINHNCRPSWVDAAKNPHFAALVYPQATRMILQRGLLGEDAWTEHDDEDSWQSRWVAFAQMLGAPEDVPNKDDAAARLEWIEEAVSAFASQNKILEMWNAVVDPMGEER
jgi:hypothetical protein